MNSSSVPRSAIIRSIHPINNCQLSNVIKSMRVAGSPTIRVVYFDGVYMTIEGTHRLEAARLLHIPVTLIELDHADLIDVAKMDIADNWEKPGVMTAVEVAAGLYAKCNGVYRLSDEGQVELISKAEWPAIPPI